MNPVIHSIEWIGEDEATLTVSDGGHTCRVFAHPFQGKANDPVREPLLCFEASGPVRTEGVEPHVRSLAGREHEVVGRVVRVSDPLVRVGDILLAPDCPLPGDIREGQLVTFRARRLVCLG
jgi:hypothetical protein